MNYTDDELRAYVGRTMGGSYDAPLVTPADDLNQIAEFGKGLLSGQTSEIFDWLGPKELAPNPAGAGAYMIDPYHAGYLLGMVNPYSLNRILPIGPARIMSKFPIIRPWLREAIAQAVPTSALHALSTWGQGGDAGDILTSAAEGGLTSGVIGALGNKLKYKGFGGWDSSKDTIPNPLDYFRAKPTIPPVPGAAAGAPTGTVPPVSAKAPAGAKPTTGTAPKLTDFDERLELLRTAREEGAISPSALPAEGVPVVEPSTAPLVPKVPFTQDVDTILWTDLNEKLFNNPAKDYADQIAFAQDRIKEIRSGKQPKKVKEIADPIRQRIAAQIDKSLKRIADEWEKSGGAPPAVAPTPAVAATRAATVKPPAGTIPPSPLSPAGAAKIAEPSEEDLFAERARLLADNARLKGEPPPVSLATVSEPAPAPRGMVPGEELVQGKWVSSADPEVDEWLRSHRTTPPTVGEPLPGAETLAPTPTTPGVSPEIVPTPTETLAQTVIPETVPSATGIPRPPMPAKIERLYAHAEKLGIVPEIEHLAAMRLSASEIAERLKKMVPKGTVNTALVRGVRTKLGIPSIEDKPAFEAWIQARQSGSLRVSPETGVPVSSPLEMPDLTVPTVRPLRNYPAEGIAVTPTDIPPPGFRPTAPQLPETPVLPAWAQAIVRSQTPIRMPGPTTGVPALRTLAKYPEQGIPVDPLAVPPAPRLQLPEPEGPRFGREETGPLPPEWLRRNPEVIHLPEIQPEPVATLPSALPRVEEPVSEFALPEVPRKKTPPEAVHQVAKAHGIEPDAERNPAIKEFSKRHVDKEHFDTMNSEERQELIDAIRAGETPTTLDQLIAANPDVVKDHVEREHQRGVQSLNDLVTTLRPYLTPAERVRKMAYPDTHGFRLLMEHALQEGTKSRLLEHHMEQFQNLLQGNQQFFAHLPKNYQDNVRGAVRAYEAALELGPANIKTNAEKGIENAVVKWTEEGKTPRAIALKLRALLKNVQSREYAARVKQAKEFAADLGETAQDPRFIEGGEFVGMSPGERAGGMAGKTHPAQQALLTKKIIDLVGPEEGDKLIAQALKGEKDTPADELILEQFADPGQAVATPTTHDGWTLATVIATAKDKFGNDTPAIMEAVKLVFPHASEKDVFPREAPVTSGTRRFTKKLGLKGKAILGPLVGGGALGGDYLIQEFTRPDQEAL